MSSSSSSVFHKYYEMNLELPNYLLQKEPWETDRGKAILEKFAKL